ncbi:MAG TPA: ATP-binding protein [Spirochaetes bacterium]|nr:ATP-binding protein [Spirochaetota bacterium]
MEDLSLHVLDVVENAIIAKASRIEIYIRDNRDAGIQTIEIIDNGTGMDKETVKKALDPFFTTKNKKTGLGIPLFAQAAKEAGGILEIQSASDKGTKIKATFKLDHIDKKPLGNMSETMRVLKATHPEVEFIYEYIVRP